MPSVTVPVIPGCPGVQEASMVSRFCYVVGVALLVAILSGCSAEGRAPPGAGGGAREHTEVSAILARRPDPQIVELDPSCGGSGQQCCDGVCYIQGECESGICVPCGGLGQQCCDG